MVIRIRVKAKERWGNSTRDEWYNDPVKQDKIFENLSESDIIKDRKLSEKRVHIK